MRPLALFAAAALVVVSCSPLPSTQRVMDALRADVARGVARIDDDVDDAFDALTIDDAPPPGAHTTTLRLRGERGWRRAVVADVRAVFARRFDVTALPWETVLTVWLEDGALAAVSIPLPPDEEGVVPPPLFALGVDLPVAGPHLPRTGERTDVVVQPPAPIGPTTAEELVARHDAAQSDAAQRPPPPPTTRTRAFYDAAGRSLDGPYLSRPLTDAWVSSRRGPRLHPILNRVRMHHGTDYAAAEGTPVVAIADGVVEKIGRDRRRGNYLVVRHPQGVRTTYLHLSAVADEVLTQRRVERGAVLAYVGMTGLATGPHLHFEITWRGRGIDPTTTEWPPGPVLDAALQDAFDARAAALRTTPPSI